MNDVMELKTPSGHTVTYKTFVSFKDKRDIQRVSVQNIVYDQQSGSIKYDGSSVYDAEDLAVKKLVVKVVDNQNQEYTNPDQILQVIGSWHTQDAEAVYSKINEITKADTLDTQKKTS